MPTLKNVRSVLTDEAAAFSETDQPESKESKRAEGVAPALLSGSTASPSPRFFEPYREYEEKLLKLRVEHYPVKGENKEQIRERMVKYAWRFTQLLAAQNFSEKEKQWEVDLNKEALDFLNPPRQ
jgi:hypothetical protein